MVRDTFFITREAFIKLGINPEEAISYLENKKVAEINPAHVKALVLLKKKPAVHSS